MSDAELLYGWATDEGTRAASFSVGPISWKEHLAWLSEVLEDTRRRLWIGVEGGREIGQARLDQGRDDELISVSLDPSVRGRGLATPLILAACRESATSVRAEIRPDNVRSVRAFESAGFVEMRRTVDRVVMVRPPT